MTKLIDSLVDNRVGELQFVNEEVQSRKWHIDNSTDSVFNVHCDYKWIAYGDNYHGVYYPNKVGRDQMTLYFNKTDFWVISIEDKTEAKFSDSGGTRAPKDVDITLFKRCPK